MNRLYPSAQNYDLSIAPKPVAVPAPQERRSTDRYRFRRPPLATFQIEQGQQSHWAPLRDLSDTGMGLEFSRSLLPGTRVTVQLRSSMANRSWVRFAQVRHATPLPEGKWLLGCSFPTGSLPEEAARLIDDDLFGFTDDELGQAVGGGVFRLTQEELGALLSENPHL